MTFERVTIEDIPVMFVSEQGEASRSAPRAFARLESALASLQGRKFYGVFDVGAIEYRACVALREGDDPEAVGCTRGVIPGGTYLRARQRGEPQDTTPRISETFAAMAVTGSPDRSRRAIQFYRRRDQVDLLFPVLP
mgnify:FL=1